MPIIHIHKGAHGRVPCCVTAANRTMPLGKLRLVLLTTPTTPLPAEGCDDTCVVQAVTRTHDGVCATGVADSNAPLKPASQPPTTWRIMIS